MHTRSERHFRAQEGFDITSIISESSNSMSASASEASNDMGDFKSQGRHTNPFVQPNDEQQAGHIRFDIRLKYVRNNKYGAKLYVDPLARMTIKIEDILSPFELEVWVNYQGDRYMSFTGTCFMLTPFFECMDPTGVIYQETEGRAFPTPNLARIPQRLYTDGQMLSAGHVPRVSPLTPQPTQGQEQVNSEIPIYHMHVKRVYVDNEGVLLYQNQGGVVYKTLIFHGYEYPPETTLHVYETKGITTVNIYDEWDNLYTVAYKDQLGHYTWQGRPIFHMENHTPRAHEGVSSPYIPRKTRPGMGEMGGYMANREPNMPHQPRKKNARIEPE